MKRYTLFNSCGQYIKYDCITGLDLDQLAKVLCDIAQLNGARLTYKLEKVEPGNGQREMPCGMYNCENPRPEKAVMCKECYQEYKDDPEAFK